MSESRQRSGAVTGNADAQVQSRSNQFTSVWFTPQPLSSVDLYNSKGSPGKVTRRRSSVNDELSIRELEEDGVLLMSIALGIPSDKHGVLANHLCNLLSYSARHHPQSCSRVIATLMLMDLERAVWLQRDVHTFMRGNTLVPQLMELLSRSIVDPKGELVTLLSRRCAFLCKKSVCEDEGGELLGSFCRMAPSMFTQSMMGNGVNDANGTTPNTAQSLDSPAQFAHSTNTASFHRDDEPRSTIDPAGTKKGSSYSALEKQNPPVSSPKGSKTNAKVVGKGAEASFAGAHSHHNRGAGPHIKVDTSNRKSIMGSTRTPLTFTRSVTDPESIASPNSNPDFAGSSSSFMGSERSTSFYFHLVKSGETKGKQRSGKNTRAASSFSKGDRRHQRFNSVFSDSDIAISGVESAVSHAYIGGDGKRLNSNSRSRFNGGSSTGSARNNNNNNDGGGAMLTPLALRKKSTKSGSSSPETPSQQNSSPAFRGASSGQFNPKRRTVIDAVPSRDALRPSAAHSGIPDVLPGVQLPRRASTSLPRSSPKTKRNHTGGDEDILSPPSDSIGSMWSEHTSSDHGGANSQNPPATTTTAGARGKSVKRGEAADTAEIVRRDTDNDFVVEGTTLSSIGSVVSGGLLSPEMPAILYGSVSSIGRRSRFDPASSGGYGAHAGHNARPVKKRSFLLEALDCINLSNQVEGSDLCDNPEAQELVEVVAEFVHGIIDDVTSTVRSWPWSLRHSFLTVTKAAQSRETVNPSFASHSAPIEVPTKSSGTQSQMGGSPVPPVEQLPVSPRENIEQLNELQQGILSTIVVLRIITPLITSMPMHLLPADEQDVFDSHYIVVRKRCTLLAKIMQKAANGQVFDGPHERSMSPFNSVMPSLVAHWKEFFMALLNVKDTSPSSSSTSVPMLPLGMAAAGSPLLSFSVGASFFDFLDSHVADIVHAANSMKPLLEVLNLSRILQFTRYCQRRSINATAEVAGTIPTSSSTATTGAKDRNSAQRNEEEGKRKSTRDKHEMSEFKTDGSPSPSFDSKPSSSRTRSSRHATEKGSGKRHSSAAPKEHDTQGDEPLPSERRKQERSGSKQPANADGVPASQTKGSKHTSDSGMSPRKSEDEGVGSGDNDSGLDTKKRRSGVLGFFSRISSTGFNGQSGNSSLAQSSQTESSEQSPKVVRGAAPSKSEKAALPLSGERGNHNRSSARAVESSSPPPQGEKRITSESVPVKTERCVRTDSEEVRPNMRQPSGHSMAHSVPSIVSIAKVTASSSLPSAKAGAGAAAAPPKTKRAVFDEMALYATSALLHPEVTGLFCEYCTIGGTCGPRNTPVIYVYGDLLHYYLMMFYANEEHNLAILEKRSPLFYAYRQKHAQFRDGDAAAYFVFLVDLVMRMFGARDASQPNTEVDGGTGSRPLPPSNQNTLSGASSDSNLCGKTDGVTNEFIVVFFLDTSSKFNTGLAWLKSVLTVLTPSLINKCCTQIIAYQPKGGLKTLLTKPVDETWSNGTLVKAFDTMDDVIRYLSAAGVSPSDLRPRRTGNDAGGYLSLPIGTYEYKQLVKERKAQFAKAVKHGAGGSSTLSSARTKGSGESPSEADAASSARREKGSYSQGKPSDLPMSSRRRGHESGAGAAAAAAAAASGDDVPGVEEVPAKHPQLVRWHLNRMRAQWFNSPHASASIRESGVWSLDVLRDVVELMRVAVGPTESAVSASRPKPNLFQHFLLGVPQEELEDFRFRAVEIFTLFRGELMIHVEMEPHWLQGCSSLVSNRTRDISDDEVASQTTADSGGGHPAESPQEQEVRKSISLKPSSSSSAEDGRFRCTWLAIAHPNATLQDYFAHEGIMQRLVFLATDTASSTPYNQLICLQWDASISDSARAAGRHNPLQDKDPLQAAGSVNCFVIPSLRHITLKSLWRLLLYNLWRTFSVLRDLSRMYCPIRRLTRAVEAILKDEIEMSARRREKDAVPTDNSFVTTLDGTVGSPTTEALREALQSSPRRPHDMKNSTLNEVGTEASMKSGFPSQPVDSAHYVPLEIQLGLDKESVRTLLKTAAKTLSRLPHPEVELVSVLVGVCRFVESIVSADVASSAFTLTQGAAPAADAPPLNNVQSVRMILESGVRHIAFSRVREEDLSMAERVTSHLLACYGRELLDLSGFPSNDSETWIPWIGLMRT